MSDFEVERMKEKIKLKQYYKQLKSNMIVWEDIPGEYQALLMKYYGC